MPSAARSFTIVQALAVAACWAFTSCGSALHAAHLPVRTFTIADGLPRDAVFCAVPDSHGFLWLCSADGVTRFDGYRFTSYGVAQGLPSAGVNQLIALSSGAVLAATDSGLSRLDPAAPDDSPHKFTSLLPVPARVRNARILDLVRDSTGRVWAAASSGVFRIDDPDQPQPRMQFIPVQDPTHHPVEVRSLAPDRRGDVWLGTAAGLARLSGDGNRIDWAREPDLPINTVLVDGGENLWAGTLTGLYRFRLHPDHRAAALDRRFTQEADGLPSNRIHTLYQSRTGAIWVGTALGLSELAPGRVVFRNYGAAASWATRKRKASADCRFPPWSKRVTIR